MASKLTCTTTQERITAITGFPLADVFLASTSARPAIKEGRLGWDTPVGTNRLGHQPGVLSPPPHPSQEEGSPVAGLVLSRDLLRWAQAGASTLQALTKEVIPGQGVEYA